MRQPIGKISGICMSFNFRLTADGVEWGYWGGWDYWDREGVAKAPILNSLRIWYYGKKLIFAFLLIFFGSHRVNSAPEPQKQGENGVLGRFLRVYVEFSYVMRHE